MNYLKQSFFEKGITETFNTGLLENNKLVDLQNIIYRYTKDQLIDHDDSLRIDEKLQIPFKQPVDYVFYDNFLEKINQEDEIKKIINSEEIKDKFKIIFDNPEKFKICQFRCKMPMKEKKNFPWHQDEGTWYLFNDKYYRNKLIGILWLSVNGSNNSNSIEIIQKSHSFKKLLKHNFKKNMGYFGVDLKEKFKNLPIKKVETKTGQAVIFHNLTLHRTSDIEHEINMIPRYSIDIRFYDKGKFLDYNVDFIYKLEKILRNFNIKFRKDGIKL